MTPGSRIGGYVAVLRKHLLILVVSVVVVGGAGAGFLWRQPRIWKDEVELLMRRPAQAAANSSARFLAIDRVGLNTEFHLLRNDTDLAAQVLERLASAGVDVAAGGYSAQSLVASVSVREVPGTEVVEFSLTGRDPESLPSAVNEYAEVYREFAQKSRAESYIAQRHTLESAADTAESALRSAEQTLARLLKQHEQLNLAAGENPASTRRQSLAAQLPEMSRRESEDRATRTRIVETLERIGVRVGETPEGIRVAASGDAASLYGALADDALVAGIPSVRAQPEIGRLRGTEDDLLQRDERLASSGMLPKHEDRLALATERSRLHDERGRVIALTLEAELREIAARAEHTRGQRDDLTALVQEEKRINGILSEYQRLDREVTTREREHDETLRRLREFGEPLSSAAGGGAAAEDTPRVLIEISKRADGARLVSPDVRLVMIMTIVAAAAVGLGMVFLFEYLDDSIQSKDDFDRYLGLPFLGFVPRIAEHESDSPDLAAEARPGSAVAESFRTIRTSILFSRGDHAAKKLLITSAGPGEGKTTIATNLSATLARHRPPVLLVDADLRKPRIAKALGVSNERGLTNILVGEASLDDVVQPTSVDGLFVVTSGTIPPNPAELLHGDNMAAFLEEAASRYERVVIDSPPILPVTDARVLASRVDGLYLAILLGRTSRRLVQRAVESLTSIGFGVHGVILNNMSARKSRGGDEEYYYYSRSGYRER